MLDADRNISIVPMSQVSTSAEGWCCVQPDRSWEHVLCSFADNLGGRERSQYGTLRHRHCFLLIDWYGAHKHAAVRISRYGSPLHFCMYK